MTHASISFNGDVQITLVPETEEDKQLLLLAFKERDLKPSFSPGSDGSVVLHLEKKKGAA